MRRLARKAFAIPDGKPSCRFYVEVDRKWQAVFTELSGLAIEMAIEDVEEGGNNEYVHRLPGRCKVGTLTLKRGITASNEFFKWSANVARGRIAKKHVSVVMYDPDGSVAMRWDFENAYPIKWSGPQFKADDTAIAVESVELAHEGMKVE
jgi:phage tail-like protein